MRNRGAEERAFLSEGAYGMEGEGAARRLPLRMPGHPGAPMFGPPPPFGPPVFARFRPRGPPEGKGKRCGKKRAEPVPKGETRRPFLNLFEKDDCYVVVANVAGVPRDEIKLEVYDDAINISTQYEIKETEENWEVLKKERAHKAFNRSVKMPGIVMPGKSTAKYENGLLTIELPKASPRVGTFVTIQ